MTAVSASSQSGSESTSSPSMSKNTASGGRSPPDPPCSRGGCPPPPTPWAPLRGDGPSEPFGSDTEVLRLGVVDDDGVGRLLGVELHLFGQLDADPGRFKQADHLGPVGQVRASGIADRIACAPVTDPEEAVEVVGIGVGDAELAPDPRMPVLGQRLGQLD